MFPILLLEARYFLQKNTYVLQTIQHTYLKENVSSSFRLTVKIYRIERGEVGAKCRKAQYEAFLHNYPFYYLFMYLSVGNIYTIFWLKSKNNYTYSVVVILSANMSL